MDITPKQKSKTNTLNLYTSITLRDIYKISHVSLEIINTIIKSYNEARTIESKEILKCGRKRKTTSRDDYFDKKFQETPRIKRFDMQKYLVNS